MFNIDFAEIMGKMESVFGKPLDEVQTAAYWEIFFDCDRARFAAACQYCIENYKHFPKPAEIKAALSSTKHATNEELNGAKKKRGDYNFIFWGYLHTVKEVITDMKKGADPDRRKELETIYDLAHMIDLAHCGGASYKSEDGRECNQDWCDRNFQGVGEKVSYTRWRHLLNFCDVTDATLEQINRTVKIVDAEAKKVFEEHRAGLMARLNQ